MTIPALLSLLLLWVAAIVKLSAVGWRSDAATRHFAISALCSATALTARAFDAEVDELVGEANVYHLIEHVLLLCGGQQVLSFVSALQPDRPVTPFRRIWNSPTTLLVLVVWTTATWFTAPIHDQHLPDPITVPDAAFLLYLVPFTVYMVAMMVSTAVFALRQAAATLATDPPPPAPRTVATSLLLIGIGLLVAVTEPIAVMLWSLIPALSPDPGNPLRVGISPVMYGGGALLAIGMVVTMVVGGTAQFIDDRHHIKRLLPLWRDLVQHFPEARMPGPSAWSITRRTSLQLVRMRVELLDCLSRLNIDAAECQVDGDLDNQALAAAIRAQLTGSPDHGRVRAIDVLTIEPTTDQTPPAALLEVADAYAAATPARATR